jgi:tetratricopeptide (TPR) repeat protein
MKKLFLTGVILMFTVIVFGQSNKVVSAYNYQKYGKLDLAKEAIDEAAQNEKTVMSAKTWFYRGNIYYDIAMSIDSNYRKLDPDPLKVSFDSYMKAKEYDTKGEYTADIDKYTQAIAEGYYNLGVMAYNNKDYKNSALNFEKAYNTNKNFGRIDTTALYNAAVAASIGKENQLAKQYYQQVIQLNYQKPDVYSSLADIYKEEGDTAMAVKVVEKGREIFPNDFNLLVSEINISLATNDKAKAKQDLELAMQMDKTNPSIFFAVGTIYDQMGNVDQAIDAYQKAIALNPEYFEANYNLGALYVNQAADILDKANDLPLDAVAEYDKQKALADEMLNKAVPYLEKSLDLNPEDLNTMVSLKEIYTRLGMTEKLKSIDEKLKK